MTPWGATPNQTRIPSIITYLYIRYLKRMFAHRKVFLTEVDVSGRSNFLPGAGSYIRSMHAALTALSENSKEQKQVEFP